MMNRSEVRSLVLEALALCQKNKGVLLDRDAKRLTDIRDKLWSELITHGTARDEVRQEISSTLDIIYQRLYDYFLR